MGLNFRPPYEAPLRSNIVFGREYIDLPKIKVDNVVYNGISTENTLNRPQTAVLEYENRFAGVAASGFMDFMGVMNHSVFVGSGTF